jgi:hypothetical protein
MTSIIASIAGVLMVIVGIVGAWLGHKAGSKDKDKEVALAKELTEQQTRAAVADETAAAAGQAMREGAASREASDANAQATAAQGDDALNAALKSQGALRDD